MSAPLPPNPNDPWLGARFSQYYRRNPPEVPDRFGRREFGYIFFGQKGMLRHVGFRTRAEFERFHWERAPAHSYYSTAYYQDPGAPTMQEKGWLGAELIFDLDADHVPGAEKLPYEQQLARVKQHFVRLVDEFIREDFGFQEKDLLLTFSGGRGYHCHVLAEKALGLTSQERREIVDYVTATGAHVDSFLRIRTPVRSSDAGPRKSGLRALLMPAAEAPGWTGRLGRQWEKTKAEIVTLPESKRYERVVELFGEVNLSNYKIRHDRLMEEIFSENLVGIVIGEQQKIRVMRALLAEFLVKQAIPLAKGETDEPVTSDTKRLIRTPGSLHGKSGLKVVKLTRDELTSFDPLRDAVAFSDEPFRMNVTKSGKVALKGESLALEAGVQDLPEWAAVFAAMRGWAEPVRRS